MPDPQIPDPNDAPVSINSPEFLNSDIAKNNEATWGKSQKPDYTKVDETTGEPLVPKSDEDEDDDEDDLDEFIEEGDDEGEDDDDEDDS